MRVLFLHQSFPAQFGRFALEMQRRHGWHCSFFAEAPGTCPAPTAEELAELPLGRIRSIAPREVPWREIPMRALQQGEAVFEAVSGRADLRPDLVVAHQTLAPTLFLPEVVRCPIVQYCEYCYGASHRDFSYRLDLPPVQPAPFYPRCVNAPILLELVMADGGYAPTHWQKHCFPQRFWPKIEVHFDGIDTQLYRPDRVGRAEAAALLAGCSVPEGTKVVTYVARGLESMRGFDRFMAVARRLSMLRSDVLFVVVGADQSCYAWDRLHVGRESFKDWVLAQGEYDPARFVFVGQIDPSRLARLLCLSDLHFYLTVPFVPSWSLFNALSCARVVLASDVEPVREVIDPGVHGLLQNFFDTEALVETALRVLDDPGAYRPLGEAARRRMEERYSLEVCHPALKEYFERMAAVKPRGNHEQTTPPARTNQPIILRSAAAPEGTPPQETRG